VWAVYTVKILPGTSERGQPYSDHWKQYVKCHAIMVQYLLSLDNKIKCNHTVVEKWNITFKRIPETSERGFM
jgi:hypothetical protein